jgi:hypothetical protein
VRRLRSLRTCAGDKTRRLTVSFGDQLSAVCRVDAWLLDFRRFRPVSPDSGLPARSRVSGAPAAFRGHEKGAGSRLCRLVGMPVGGRIALTCTPVSASPLVPDHLEPPAQDYLQQSPMLGNRVGPKQPLQTAPTRLPAAATPARNACLKTVTEPFQLRRIYSIRPRGY